MNPLNLVYSTVKTLLITAILLPPGVASADHVVSDTIDLTTSKVSHITGSITESLVRRFQIELLATVMIPGDRIIIIDSLGGYTAMSSLIFQMISAERSPATRMVCIVTKHADSMAFNLLTQACDIRLASPDSTFLVHKVSTAYVTPGSSRLTSKTLREVAAELDATDEPYRQANASAMKLSIADYDQFADAETTWTADKLIQMKYLGGIGYVSQ